ncbi:MAG: PilN domain-containing protein [Phascolarctobacterium sp.]|nr:PilN domain-containing protein [Phascolarctobacterium sp.]
MKKYFACVEKLSSLYKIPLEKQKVVILDAEQVFTCRLVLPVMPKKEVAEAVRWELPLHVPYEDGTYYFAYKSLGLNDGMENLQVYVVLKSLVQKLEEEANLQGLVLTEVRVAGEEVSALNLLPDGEKRKLLPKTKLYKLGIIILLLLGALCFSVAWCYNAVQVSNLRKAQVKLESLRPWQERYEKQEARGQKIKTLSTAIAKLEKERVLWSELLLVLGASVPKDCWLTTIKQREVSQIVELQGKAKEMEQIKKLLTNLQASKNFNKVTLTETNAIKGELLGYKIVVYGKGMGE